MNWPTSLIIALLDIRLELCSAAEKQMRWREH